MDLILIGLCVGLNFIVLIHKYRLKRYADATLDMLLLAIICFLFSGTFSALVAGTIASVFISSYLYFKPVSLGWFTAMFKNEDDEDYED